MDAAENLATVTLEFLLSESCGYSEGTEMATNVSALIKSGQLHHFGKLVVAILFLNVSQVFREIFVVYLKCRLVRTLKRCYAKGCSQITAIYTKIIKTILMLTGGIIDV